MPENNNNNIGSLISVSMERIKELIDVNTIVGDTITTPDGITVIPISRVSFGFFSGGADIPTKNQSFGGGAGAGVSLKPEAFIIIKPDGDVRLLQMNVKNSVTDDIIEHAPEFFASLKGLFGSGKEKIIKSESESKIKSEPTDKKEDKITEETIVKKKKLFGN